MSSLKQVESNNPGISFTQGLEWPIVREKPYSVTYCITIQVNN